MENLQASEVVKKNEDLNNLDLDFVIKVINGNEYNFKLSYKNSKYLLSRFNISISDFEYIDKEFAKILYSSISKKNNEKDRGTFEDFENDIDNETIEDLIELAERIIGLAFPKKMKEVKEQIEAENKKK